MRLETLRGRISVFLKFLYADFPTAKFYQHFFRVTYSTLDTLIPFF